jgi:hypothetical protein
MFNRIFLSPSPLPTSNFTQQQPLYSNGNEKASSGTQTSPISSSQQTMANDSAAAETISKLGKQEEHPYTNAKN